MRRTLSLYPLLLVFLSYIMIIIKPTTAMVLLKSVSISYPDLPARLTLPLNCSGLCGTLHVSDPLNACSPLHNRFELNGSSSSIALVVRGECDFEDKIRNVQDSGFQAVVVFDAWHEQHLVEMWTDRNPDGVKVHAVFVSKETGEDLMAYAGEKDNECCIVPSCFYGAWNVWEISICSLIVIVAVLITVVPIILEIIPRHGSCWPRINIFCKSMDGRNRMVDELPKFTSWSSHLKNHQNGDTCAICLEDYKDGEVFKVLPCLHEFHSTCIDSWLTRGTFCPVCKLEMKS